MRVDGEDGGRLEFPYKGSKRDVALTLARREELDVGARWEVVTRMKLVGCAERGDGRAVARANTARNDDRRVEEYIMKAGPSLL